MFRIPVVVFALLVAPLGIVSAQTVAPEPEPGAATDSAAFARLIERIEGEERIRLTSGDERLVVERPWADADGISYTDVYGRPGRLAWGAVSEVEVQRRHPWLGAAAGAAILGGAGLMFGAISSGCAEDACDAESKDSGKLFVIGAGVGAVVGFALGSTRTTWSSVYSSEVAPPLEARISVRPGRVAAGLRLRI